MCSYTKIMKSIFTLIFVFSLGTATYLGFEYFDVQNPKSRTPASPFQKGSLEEKIFNDFSELKNKKQLPAEFADISGYVIFDQRSDQSTKLSREILTALKKVTPLRGDGRYEVELMIFDTTQEQKVSEKKTAPLAVKAPRKNEEKEKSSPPTTAASSDNKKNDLKESEDNSLLVFQFSIIHKKTKNKVAELGRTYSVK